jgi:type IV secretion system protein VirD4
MELLALTQFFLKLGLGSMALVTALKLRENRIKLATAEIGTDLKGYEGNTGLKLSTNKRLSEKASQEHIIIIAPTGAGKTTSLYIPNLLENNLQGSLIIADPKGELYKLTHKYQESIGRKTILYKPLDGKIEYNPLKECKTNSEVYQLAQNLLINGALSIELQTGKKSGGVEWLQMSQSLLTAALLYSDTIQNALKLIINNTTETLDQIFDDCENEAVHTQYNAFKMCLDSPKTMSSIKITISSNLQLFLDDLKINKSSFNAETLCKDPTALYISYPENKSNYLSPLMACIYSQLTDKLIDSYSEKSMPIHFLIDEFANQGQWANMSQNIATARSRKISFVLCLQSISQLKQIYGHDNALSILNNCKTKIILPGISDIETLEYISKLCGEEEILIQQEGRKVKTKKLLFTMDEIRRLKDDELLIISKNFRPILEKQNTWYNQEFYKDRAK